MEAFTKEMILKRGCGESFGVKRGRDIQTISRMWKGMDMGNSIVNLGDSISSGPLITWSSSAVEAWV